MPADRRRPARGTGRHFLLPDAARDLARRARLSESDTVVDIGAGWGALTGELARRAGRVIAVEMDAELAAAARRRLRHQPNVTVVERDFHTWPLPHRPFRVVANLPFAGSTAILGRLLGEPSVPLLRVDAVVQLGAARGWTGASARPDAVSWHPWYAVRLDRRLSRNAFRPRPSVDAAVLVAARRPQPMLRPHQWRAFARFVSTGFAGGSVRHQLRGAVTERSFTRVARDHGLARDPLPTDVPPDAWVALYRLASGAARRSRSER